MRRAIVLVVLLTTVAGTGHMAVAGPSAADEARAVATKGTEAAASGDLPGAIALFKQARALDDRAEYLCNVGYAYQLLGDLPRAHLFISECLVRAAAMDAAVADAFRARLTEVEGALRAGGFVPVDVTVSPRGAEIGVSAFSTDETAPGPRVLWLPAGRHTISVAAPGHERRAVDVDVVGTGRHAVSIDLVHTAAAEPDVPVDRVPVAIDTRPSRTPAVIAFAGGGLALAAGGVFHVLALRTRDDIAENFPTEGPDRSAREDTWRTQVTGMAVGYGVGAVAIGVGAYLWWKTGRAPTTVRTSGGERSVMLGWRF